jgi:uncharacterized protein (DUF1800 family)
VVTKLWNSFIGGPPDQRAVDRWARGFRASGYEIAPLLSSMLHSDEFKRARGSRPRTPIEWHSSVARAADFTESGFWDLEHLGQAPYLPPNVSGWPPAEVWLSPTQAHARARLLSTLSFPAAAALGAQSDLVGSVLDRCSLFVVSDRTRDALTTLDAELRADPMIAPSDRASMVLSTAFLSPEFAIA